MKTGFSNRMKEVFTFVREEVVRLGGKTIRIEHLFLGIIRDGGGSAIEVLKNLEIDPEELKIIIENTINNNINIRISILIVSLFSTSIMHLATLRVGLFQEIAKRSRLAF